MGNWVRKTLKTFNSYKIFFSFYTLNSARISSPREDYATIRRTRHSGRVRLRMFHDSVSRDREDERATGHPQGLESEAYLNSTSQGSRAEDTQKDDHIHGRSSRIMEYPG
jgi:hypothetical protein